MKPIVFVALALSTCHALASYELLYVVDRATTGTKVHRFDGDTGAYLGGFGVDLTGNANGIAVNSKGEVFVSDYKKVFVYNGSTGGLLRELTTTFTDLTNLSLASNGDLLVCGFQSGAFRLNSNTGAILAAYVQPSGGAGMSGIYQGPSGHIYAGIRGINKVQRYFWTGGADTLSSTTDTLSDCLYGGQSGDVVYQPNGTGSKVVRYDISTSPAAVMTSLNFSGLGAFAVTGVAAGHGNRMFMSVWGSSNSYIQRFDKNDGSLRGSFGSSVLKNPVNMVAVVAPEPSSLIVLGAAFGLTAISRRRRAR